MVAKAVKKVPQTTAVKAVKKVPQTTVVKAVKDKA
jgi:hypothetical protein